MKYILKFVSYLLFFIFMLIIFLPKANIYYFALENLQEKKIQISNKTIKDNPLGLIIKDINIKYENIGISDISKILVKTYLFYTTINIDNIKVDNSLNKFVPNEIKNITISYSVIDPMKIKITSNFSMGSCTGSIDLMQKVVKLDIIAAKKFKSKYRHIVKQLKQIKTEPNSKEDRYTYEYKY